MSQEMLGKLADAVVKGETNVAEALAKEVLENGLDPLQCITEGLTKGIQKVGNQAHEVVGTIVLGTVEGDLHEISKTLMGTMLTANGFKVIDIGVDKPASEFIDAVKESGANLVGASALLTTTMLQQENLIGALKEAGLREQVMVMVGGAPVTESYANHIGADGYAEDAISAVGLAMRLVDAPA
jgi:methanogenic corrinoid protein MtbC1